MKNFLNAQNNLYLNKPEAKNPTFGIRIPKLETEIDAFITRTNNTSNEELSKIFLLIVARMLQIKQQIKFSK